MTVGAVQEVRHRQKPPCFRGCLGGGLSHEALRCCLRANPQRQIALPHVLGTRVQFFFVIIFASIVYFREEIYTFTKGGLARAWVGGVGGGMRVCCRAACARRVLLRLCKCRASFSFPAHWHCCLHHDLAGPQTCTSGPSSPSPRRCKSASTWVRSGRSARVRTPSRGWRPRRTFSSRQTQQHCWMRYRRHRDSDAHPCERSVRACSTHMCFERYMVTVALGTLGGGGPCRRWGLRMPHRANACTCAAFWRAAHLAQHRR